ncbi:MAG: cysteine-rich CWC family protein [Chitinophagaceae bacterium]
MPIHEIKVCAKCNKNFECKVGNILECQCNQIQLSYEEKSIIENSYEDCLCIDCLYILRYQIQQKIHLS